MKKCTKYFTLSILSILGIFLYLGFSLLPMSYKFDNTPLQLSPLAKNFLECDLKKGLVIGRTSFEGTSKKDLVNQIKQIKNKINVLKSDKPTHYELSSLENRLNILEKIKAIDIWFYLDPCATFQNTFDDSNVPLVATWPLEKDKLDALKDMFEVVVLDPGVYEYIDENDKFIRIFQREGKHLEEKHRKILMDLCNNSFQFLKDVMSTLKFRGLFLCDRSVLENLSIVQQDNVSLKKILLKEAGCEWIALELDRNEKGWILPHNDTCGKRGRNWVGVSECIIFSKSVRLIPPINGGNYRGTKPSQSIKNRASIGDTEMSKDNQTGNAKKKFRVL